MLDKAVHPAQVEALKGTVMQLMPSKSAINLPASRTLPPPAAIIPSQLFFFEN